jgi:hypothetical protein
MIKEVDVDGDGRIDFYGKIPFVSHYYVLIYRNKQENAG